jgi:hypothetical protein
LNKDQLKALIEVLYSKNSFSKRSSITQSNGLKLDDYSFHLISKQIELHENIGMIHFKQMDLLFP